MQVGNAVLVERRGELALGKARLARRRHRAVSTSSFTFARFELGHNGVGRGLS